MDLHNEIGHFGGRRTLAKITKCYFWHNCTKEVKDVVRSCKQCQLMKHISSIKSELEELKNIPTWDQFYKVALDAIRPLLDTYNGNRYILLAIDHYFKWCETKAVIDHDVEMIARFLEDEIICKFVIPKYIFINCGFEWVAKFD